MAEKISKEINQTVRRFAAELQKEILVEKIFLFGSHAYGSARPDSDIDLLVVSPQFSKGRYITHMQYLFRKAAAINSRIEPIPVAPEAIKRPDKRLFLGQILPTAKVFAFRRKK
jgi:predicted nucleotidyltransferase